MQGKPTKTMNRTLTKTRESSQLGNVVTGDLLNGGGSCSFRYDQVYA
jgi:hypothetical protein